MDITPYLIGHLLGRLFASVLIVWLICWLFSRLKFKPSIVALKRWYSLLAVVLIWLLGIAGSARAGEDSRAMAINQVEALQLTIWTEAQPNWPTRLEQHRGRSVFVAESPDNYYPPAAMSWAVMPFNVTDAELDGVFQQALKSAQNNYQSRSGVATASDKVYGTLAGRQATFQGKVGNQPVDVRFFIGSEPGKPLIVMQAYTLPDKLPHLKHQIRRSWNNVSYR
ncbi:hypothetical protein [Amphritea balenae]|uniref:Uncharacterized protein n=1 Tax=Amphritea balenae TaxID=452629 RepID=A0A3P1SN78_9GAMM|nr:hypothetical protein [Amphritea balenae]RRC98608.1 hypothetical protein EHS89_13435 [Amphritea balenae]GGK65898.1 hypothetical protein GCM10007941_15150 [Amphritea balenae]